MTTDADDFRKIPRSGTGTFKAEIDNGYSLSVYDGSPYTFVTDGEEVVLKVRHQLDLNTWYSIRFQFKSSVENKRYDFRPGDNLIPYPPSFSKTLFNEESSDHHTWGFTSVKNVGYIKFDNFDHDKGILIAELNFTFEDFNNKDERHQVNGDINVAGLEIIDHKTLLTA